MSEQFLKKLNGETRFVTDITPKDTIYAVTIRSTIHKGEIQSIQLPDLPVDYSIVDYKKIPGKNKISIFQEEMPILAESSISYLGQPILLLSGPDKIKLKEIAAKIKIHYIEEPAILSLDEISSNELSDCIKISRGNLFESFNTAERIIEREYITAHQYPLNIESLCAVALCDSIRTIIYISSNYPFNVRDNAASCLGTAKKNVRVIVPNITAPLGGNFIGPALLSCHAALITRIVKKPVRIEYTQLENFYYTASRHAFHITYTTALVKKKAEAHRINVNVDTGAYNFLKNQIINNLTAICASTYQCNNIELNIVFNKTNLFPMGGINGPGEAEITFAREIHSEVLAECLDIDPFTWKNSQLSGINLSFPKRNFKPITSSLHQVLEKVIEISDFRRKYDAYAAIMKKHKNLSTIGMPTRGIGLSLCPHNLIIGQEGDKYTYEIKIVLEKDKKLRIMTSAIDSLNSKSLLLAGIASNMLKIPLSSIEIEQVDTDKVPDFGANTGSKGILILMKLMEQCCEIMKEKINSKEYPVEVKKHYTVQHNLFHNFEDYNNNYLNSSWEGTVVEIEIDPISLEYSCRGIWIVVAAGEILNPDMARIHIESSAIQNLEYATVKHNFITIQKFPSEKMIEYSLHTALDIPRIQIEFLINKDKKEPAMGLGAQPVLGIAPALTIALSQAADHIFTEIPITPQIIKKSMEE